MSERDRGMTIAARAGAPLAFTSALWVTALLMGLMPPIPARAADTGLWECQANLCTARQPLQVANFEGVFEYGANLGTAEVDRIAELEQQRWREFRFAVTARARLTANIDVDPSYVPADWPVDIGPGDSGVRLSRHYSLDGETYRRFEDGFVLPEGAFLSIIVEQDTLADGSGPVTYYPAKWRLGVFAARVVAAAAADGIDLSLMPMLPDTGAIGRAAEGGTVMGAPAPGDPMVLDAGDATADDEPQPVADPEPERPADPGPEADPLAAELQAELARVGCYTAAVDGLWGPASRRAMTNFNRWAGADASVSSPTPKALVTVARTPAPVCGDD